MTLDSAYAPLALRVHPIPSGPNLLFGGPVGAVDLVGALDISAVVLQDAPPSASKRAQDRRGSQSRENILTSCVTRLFSLVSTSISGHSQPILELLMAA